jgi:UDP-N-acetylmuramoyl-tripeptide--D-alanyl-D-alanine ligase
MIQLNTTDIVKLLDAQFYGDTADFIGVSIDSRSLQPGNLFIAINGAQSNGHQYIQEAKNKGAVAALVEQRTDVDIPQLVINDTTIAMGTLANFWRKRFSIPFVAVTGSCGKTTTTRMIFSVLSQQGETLLPQGNFNNQWGVPLTLFNLNENHHFAVIEMGADRPGEIQYLASLVEPDVAVITNVAPVHLEVSQGIGFGDIEGVFNEKSEIYKSLNQSGTAIICADDTFFPEWQKKFSQNSLSFGLNEQADVTAKNIEKNKGQQYAFDVICKLGEAKVKLSSIGRHNIVNALAAIATCLPLGSSLSDIQKGLASVPTAEHRMAEHHTKEGAVLIDDCYNANIKSMKAILEMLSEHSGPTIAILGDMGELGEQSDYYHRMIGEYAKNCGIAHLFAFGPKSIAIAQGFGDNAHHFIDDKLLLDEVVKLLNKNTMVIVKGSRCMNMESIVKELIN